MSADRLLSADNSKTTQGRADAALAGRLCAMARPQTTCPFDMVVGVGAAVSDSQTSNARSCRTDEWVTQTMTLEAAKQRIAEIDAKFEAATGWGSWMVMLANEREDLATQLNLPQKYQARCGGQKTD